MFGVLFVALCATNRTIKMFGVLFVAQSATNSTIEARDALMSIVYFCAKRKNRHRAAWTQ